MKGFALALGLRQRIKATQKWPNQLRLEIGRQYVIAAIECVRSGHVGGVNN